MFAADSAEVSAALNQLQQHDELAGGLEPAATDASGMAQSWDDDTPADASWQDDSPAASPQPVSSPSASPRSAARSSSPASINGPTFSAAAVVKSRAEGAPSSSPDSSPAVASPSAARPSPSPAAEASPGRRQPRVTATPPPTGAAALTEKPAPAASSAARGSRPQVTPRANEVLLCTAELRGDYTPLDVLSARAEGADYGAAVERLKEELRRGCRELGGDAVLHLRIEREDAGRVVYGTGTVVRRG
jgi:hypothetical protein